jgi:enolase
MAVNVGDEGGFAPDVDDPYQAVELILEAFEKAGVAGKFGIAMDVAASEFVVTEGGVMK